jgi:hypothetical protein
MRPLEDVQDILRAIHGKSGDRTKILLAQHDRAGFVRHRYLLVRIIELPLPVIR